MSIVISSSTSSTTNADGTAASRELDKDDFLKLLITKLEYQDPLNPMKDEDFVAQLAQFSSLEQMNNIAEAIEESNKWDFLQMQSVNNTMASGLIGKDIKADYSGVILESDKDATIAFTLSKAASEITFTVKDENGDVVRTFTVEDVSSGASSTTWDGRNNAGNRVGEGYYTITAAAVDTDGGSFTPSMSLSGTVEKITYRDGGAFLTVNGMEVPLGDVQAVAERGVFSQDDD